MILIEKPLPGETPEHYQDYIDEVKPNDLLKALRDNRAYAINTFKKLPADRHDYRYDEGKWTPKEIIQHLIDCERIFAYRALRFARFDTTELAGFEENEYVENGNANQRTLDELIEEYKAVREATVQLFLSLDENMLVLRGIANGKKISVRALGFAIAGHELHHLRVMRDRYFE